MGYSIYALRELLLILALLSSFLFTSTGIYPLNNQSDAGDIHIFQSRRYDYLEDFGTQREYSVPVRRYLQAQALDMVSTVAGGNSGNINGIGTYAKLGSPNSLTYDSINQILYLADTSNHAIRSISLPMYIVSTVAGACCGVGTTASYLNGQGTNSLFSSPQGIVYAYPGILYVTDYSNHRIRSIDVSNNFMVLTFAGSGGLGVVNGIGTYSNFYYPGSITYDGVGNLYVTDFFVIRSIQIQSVLVQTMLATGNAALDLCASNGILYFSTLNLIRVVNITTMAVTTLAGGGGLGTATGNANGFGTYASFYYAAGITSDYQGNLYIADSNNYLVRSINIATTVVSTVAGHASAVGNGVGTYANFQSLNKILYANGILYVVEQSQNTIKSINLLNKPSSQPSTQPSDKPSRCPTSQPSLLPSRQPSSQPSNHPSRQPTSQPLRSPTEQPSSFPSHPSAQPSTFPSRQPTATPSHKPSCQPSLQPLRKPTSQPSTYPSHQPTEQPSSFPSHPSSQPSTWPSCHPSSRPSRQPSSQPACHPTSAPSSQPSIEPSRHPTSRPSHRPTAKPANRPSSQPSSLPSYMPSSVPLSGPSSQPGKHPSTRPSTLPSGTPSMQPSRQPTSLPFSGPTFTPSTSPTMRPSLQPSTQPTVMPLHPTSSPSAQPSDRPTRQPADVPTARPSYRPSRKPSSRPSLHPTTKPSMHPSSQPSSQPFARPLRSPSWLPSSVPTRRPSSQPSHHPSHQPASKPSCQPIAIPSAMPSRQPTQQPSTTPTAKPSRMPITSRPTHVGYTNAPTSHPTSSRPTSQPTQLPTKQPAPAPSTWPTGQPRTAPTSPPTGYPSTQPTGQPSGSPSTFPSAQPRHAPTGDPSERPSTVPTMDPTQQPVGHPSRTPTVQPWAMPSVMPSRRPTVEPTDQPTNKPSGQPTSTPSDVVTEWAVHVDTNETVLIAHPFLQNTILTHFENYCIESTWKSQQPTGKCSFYAAVLFCLYRVPWCSPRITACRIDLPESSMYKVEIPINLELNSRFTTCPPTIIIDGHNATIHTLNNQFLIVKGSSKDLTSNRRLVAPSNKTDWSLLPSFSIANLSFISSSAVSSVTSEFNGGCLLVSSIHRFQLQDVYFSGYTSGGAGGAVAGTDIGFINIRRSSLISNSATGGGAVALWKVGQVEIIQSLFIDNAAINAGGALMIDAVNVINIDQTQFIQNTGGQFGGSISVNVASQVSITSSMITQSIAHFGSAMALSSCTDSWISRNEVIGNNALQAGTIYWIASSMASEPRISVDNIFADNINPNAIAGGGGDTITTEPYRFITGFTGGTNAIEITSYIPDQNQLTNLRLSLVDYYGRVLASQSNMTVTAAIASGEDLNCGINSPFAKLTGGTVAQAMAGVVTFSNLGLQCIPGGSMNITFTTPVSGYGANLAIYSVGSISSGASNALSVVFSKPNVKILSTALFVTFRRCIIGEIFDFSPGLASACLVCEGGYSVADSADNSVLACSPCPPLADHCYSCWMYLHPGQWRWTSTATTIYQCPFPTGCLGSNFTGPSGCALGYLGPACGICSDGYFQSGNICESCAIRNDASPQQIAYYVLATIFLLLPFCYVVYQVFLSSDEDFHRLTSSAAYRNNEPKKRIRGIPFEDQHDENWSAQHDELTARSSIISQLKICVVTYQMILQASNNVNGKFPPSFKQLLASLSILNLDVGNAIPVYCTSWQLDFGGTMIVMTALPIGGLVLMVLFFVIQAYCRQANKYHLQLLRDRYILFLLLISFVILPPISLTIFKIFDCVNLDLNGDDPLHQRHLVLRNDYSINCDSDYYLFLLVWAIFMVLLYPVAMVITYFVLLFGHRYQIQARVQLEAIKRSPHIADRRHTMTIESRHFYETLGFLFVAYKPQYWYWELVEVCRRLIMNCVLGSILPGSAQQIIIGIVLATMFMKVYHQCQPFADMDTNLLDAVGQFQIWFTYYAAWILKHDMLSEVPNGRQLLDFSLVSVNIAMVVMVLYGSRETVMYTVNVVIAYFRNSDTSDNKICGTQDEEEEDIDSSDEGKKFAIRYSYKRVINLFDRFDSFKFSQVLNTFSDLAVKELQGLVLADITLRQRKRNASTPDHVYYYPIDDTRGPLQAVRNYHGVQCWFLRIQFVDLDFIQFVSPNRESSRDDPSPSSSLQLVDVPNDAFQLSNHNFTKFRRKLFDTLLYDAQMGERVNKAKQWTRPPPLTSVSHRLHRRATTDDPFSSSSSVDDGSISLFTWTNSPRYDRPTTNNPTN